MTCKPHYPDLVSQPPQCAPWWEVGAAPILIIGAVLFLGMYIHRQLRTRIEEADPLMLPFALLGVVVVDIYRRLRRTL